MPKAAKTTSHPATFGIRLDRVPDTAKPSALRLVVSLRRSMASLRGFGALLLGIMKGETPPNQAQLKFWDEDEKEFVPFTTGLCSTLETIQDVKKELYEEGGAIVKAVCVDPESDISLCGIA